MGRKIEAVVGEVQDVGLFGTPGNKGPLVKALIQIDITKPLKKGANLGVELMAYSG